MFDNCRETESGPSDDKLHQITSLLCYWNATSEFRNTALERRTFPYEALPVCLKTSGTTTTPSVANHCNAAYFRHFSCLTHIGSVVTQAKIVRVSNFVNLNEIIVMQKRTKWRRLKNWEASVTMNRKTATKFFTSTCDNLIFCDKKKQNHKAQKFSLMSLLNGHDSLLIFNRVFVAVSTF